MSSSCTPQPQSHQHHRFITQKERSQEPNTDSAGGSAHHPSPPVSPVPTPVCVWETVWGRQPGPTTPSEAAHCGTNHPQPLGRGEQPLCSQRGTSWHIYSSCYK